MLPTEKAIEIKRKREVMKCAILNSGIDKEVSRASYQNYCGDDTELKRLTVLYGDPIVKVALGVLNSLYHRRKRVCNRVEKYILAGNVVFLTFTFNDETLKTTSEKTRRVYMRRFLKEFCSCYVANIDYGGKKGREHYHALCVPNKKPPFGKWFLSKKERPIGFIKGLKVGNTKDDVEATCKYVAKLTNHAMKCNDGRYPRLIYSRKVVL